MIGGRAGLAFTRNGNSSITATRGRSRTEERSSPSVGTAAPSPGIDALMQIDTYEKYVFATSTARHEPGHGCCADALGSSAVPGQEREVSWRRKACMAGACQRRGVWVARA